MNQDNVNTYFILFKTIPKGIHASIINTFSRTGVRNDGTNIYIVLQEQRNSIFPGSSIDKFKGLER